MKKPTYQTRVLILTLFLFASTVAGAQNILTKEANLIQSGDSLIKECVEYVSAGDAGDNAVWDFCGFEETGSKYQIRFSALDSTGLVAYDARQTVKYTLSHDSLFLVEVETPQQNTKYSQLPLILSFPFGLNQTFKTCYNGEGRYCGTHYKRNFGTVKTIADGQGTIILSESDTLPNTLRVYTVTTEAIRLNKDSCRNDSDNLKQVITEHYRWYTRGYRYPVFETITSSTYDNLNHVGTQQYAYRCPPDMQTGLTDDVNEQIRKEDKSMINYRNKGESSTNQDGGTCFHYDIKTNGNQVTVTYDITATSRIHVMIVDIMGRVYRDLQQTNDPGIGYVMDIDCSGLHRGQYIFYINVNGTIYNAKIPIK